MKRVLLLLITILTLISGAAGCGKTESDEESSGTEKAVNESYTFDILNNEYVGKQSDDEMGDYQICFTGSVDQFTEIQIGKGIDGEVWGWYLAVDEDTVRICDKQNECIAAEYPHDLSVKDYLGIDVLADLRGSATIEINTNGGRWVQNEVPWIATVGTLYVKSVGENKLSNCQLSYFCNGWDKDIWLYGDSYFSMTEEDRWTSYLVEKECNNILLNGRSGKSSAEALASLKIELQYGCPKTIVWCMGMNDGDSETSVNESWLSCVTEVQEICEKNDIELILATIPTNPYWYNERKNEYVRESGYKYIDFSQAVGADDNILWYDGMLEEGENRIHPTEAGAVALYQIAVTTVPQLLQRDVL